MKNASAKILALVMAISGFTAEAWAQYRSQAVIGRTLISSIPPTTDDWLLVLKILARGADRTTEMAADATLCVRGDEEVVSTLFQLYHSPGLETARGRLARPVSGLQQAGAARVAGQIVMDPRYPPDHELCVGAAKSALRNLGVEGVKLVVDKLDQWGELPLEESLDKWPGLPLTEILAENSNPDTIPSLLATLKGGEGTVSSGGRLGAACALLKLGDRVSAVELQTIIDGEKNPTVRDCLVAVAKARDNREEKDGGQGVAP